MTLPPIPKDRKWSPETWRAGLDEAVRRNTDGAYDDWEGFGHDFTLGKLLLDAIIAHATTLLDAGIVKPVVSEAEKLLNEVNLKQGTGEGIQRQYRHAAIAIIQSALDKARDGC